MSDDLIGMLGRIGITVNGSGSLTIPTLAATTFTATTINGLTVTTSTGTLTVPNGTTTTAPAFNDTLVAGGQAVTTATFNIVNTTTLANVTGLSVNVLNSGTYRIRGLLAAIGAAGNGVGVKAAIGGTATLTSGQIKGENFNGTTYNATTWVTALGSDLANFANTCTDVKIDGTIVVNAAGTITVQAAQATANATTTTITKGSFLELLRIS
ncbi:MAG: hypothetical protein KGJ90_05115 [Patescibacteria group bacterium]|nr:hypothetical protein [Patescibacteria group bacterium]